MGKRLKMFDKIVFASKNKGKINEVKQLFSSINVTILPVSGDFEVVEDGKTFLDNAIIKARKAAEIMNCVSLADDSGLTVEALNGEPGVYSSRYADNDRNRINKLLKALENVPLARRNAEFVCSMALVSADGEVLHTTSGVCKGIIALEPKGSSGFGFDPVFFLPELNCTMAEISMEKKNTLSHRSKALRQMLSWISDNN